MLVPSGRRTCVRPGVPLQLVAACEALAAENPAAHKGPLAGVQPHVRSEERRFPEGLLTSGDVADVFPLPHFPRPVARTRRSRRNKTFIQKLHRQTRFIAVRRDMHEQANARVALTSCLRLYSWDTCTPCASSFPPAGWAVPA